MKSSASQRAETLVKTLRERPPVHFIGGVGAEPDGGATLKIINPADGQMVARSAGGNDRDVDRAVRSAQGAFDDGWPLTTPSERASLLAAAATTLETNARDFAILTTLETGKTYRESLTIDVQWAIAALRYYAGWTTKSAGELHDLGGGYLGLVSREPQRVVGAITSWQFPLAFAAWKAGAALAAGACLVIKPSKHTPLATMRFAELLTKAGVPPGVINVVTGDGPSAGNALALHPGVESVSLSGTIETARRVLVASAKSNLKPIHLTLGGKAANILFEDADMKRAMASAWKAIFAHRGAMCTAGSRLLAHHTLYDDVVHTITARARQLVVGDPLDDHTEMGPIISEAQMNRVLGYAELGRQEGARLVAGGGRDVEGTKANGFFVSPTVFMDTDPSMRITQEEIPGPVLTIQSFRHEDEAIEIANGTSYGMAAALWTADLRRAHRVARKLRAGVVWVNQYDVIDPSLPFGGRGLSGQGRELGESGLAQCQATKTIYVPAI
ncbi:MAG: aldehyde dehydrogenase family protein [Deltaproteobacteria bacterium]|nr:aldehyde dehydrogenase family protein [Deltaproteobacteria bacterium]